MPEVENKTHIYNINTAIVDAVANGLKIAAEGDENMRYAAVGGAVLKVMNELGLRDPLMAEAFAKLVRENPPTPQVATSQLQPLQVFGALAETSKTSNLIGLKSARHLELDDNLYLGIIDEDVLVSDRAAAIFSMVSSMATAPVSETITLPAGSEWKAACLERVVKLFDVEHGDFGPAQMAQIGTIAFLMLLNHGRELRAEDGGSFNMDSLLGEDVAKRAIEGLRVPHPSTSGTDTLPPPVVTKAPRKPRKPAARKPRGQGRGRKPATAKA